MQVKKFEAPTLQEALDTIKRELGPEAIILQTKQNRRGFGLMSKGSVEVTAAVSERAVDKKAQVERRLPQAYAQKMATAPASRQADFYESYLERKIENEKVQLSAASGETQKRITATRYADIEDDAETIAARSERTASIKTETPALPVYSTSDEVGASIDHYQEVRSASLGAIEDEIASLKRLVEELRRERKKPEYLESDSPFSATDALQEGYETLLQSGIERRFAVSILRDVARNLSVESRADHDLVLDAIADQLLKKTATRAFFNRTLQSGQQEIAAFVGVSGVGKTALIAKLATHAARSRNEKIGVIRIQLNLDEGMDPLIVFAKALHIPYRAVQNMEELLVAVQDMSQCARIFIDTPGISPKDQNATRKLESLLKGVDGLKVELVISASTRDLELHEQGKAFSTLSLDCLMVTRLDETYSFGSIYSLSQKLGLPISIFSTGKKVTEQWENASAERLTASILSIL